MTRTKEKSRTEQSRVDKNGLILYIRSFSTDVALIVVTSNRKREGERKKKRSMIRTGATDEVFQYIYMCVQRDVEKEGTKMGHHTAKERKGNE